MSILSLVSEITYVNLRQNMSVLFVLLNKIIKIKLISSGYMIY